MKKQMLMLAAALSLCAGVHAYNPPVGGENFYALTNPDMIMGGASATGGAFLNIVPSSICFNPALSGIEQRSIVDLSGTLFFNTDKVDFTGDADEGAGFGFQAGTIIPTRYYVFAATAQGLFADFNTLNLRDSFTVHGGISKEIIEDVLYVGMNLYGGVFMGSGADFTVGADFGALYFFDENIGFLKKPRMGFALLNVGKPLSGYEIYGYKDGDGVKNDSTYPSILTPRASFAATLFDSQNFDGAFSVDLSFPTFQNLVCDVSFATTFFKMMTLSSSYQLNMRELSEGSNAAVLPSIGLSFHFVFSSNKLKDEWAQSELVPSLAWQKLYKDIHALSFGAKVNLGMADKSAPEIILWDEE